jgi:hypothetical protein
MAFVTDWQRFIRVTSPGEQAYTMMEDYQPAMNMMKSNYQ